MRLDKFCSNLGWFTRNIAKSYIKKRSILVNNVPVSKPDYKLSLGDVVFDQQFLSGMKDSEKGAVVKDNYYAIIHKTSGHVSADVSEYGWPSYRQLLDGWPYSCLVHVAGRLDQDTEGLLIVTSDGKLIHRIISPKKKVEKLYYVECENPVDQNICDRLSQGVVLDTGYETAPARCSLLGSHTLHLALTEGKFHQVKKMLEAVGNNVRYLRREKIGGLDLCGLKPGEWKEFTYEEIVARIYGSKT